MTKSLLQLLAALPPDDLIAVSGDVAISAPVVEADGDVQPGGVFVARRGLSVDGHEFIPRAVQRGAAAVVGTETITGLAVPYIQVRDAQEAVGYLAAAYHDFPSRKLIVIGVTGTDGKTTTSTLIHSILQTATGGKAGLISTVSAIIGAEALDTGLHVTTPGAPQIQALLARMVANGLTHVVLEMTSHGLAQGRLNGVHLDVAVLTNLTHEHLDYHETFENYRSAKARMFRQFGHKQDQWYRGGIINLDDPNAPYFAEVCKQQGVPVYGYSLEKRSHADGIFFFAENIAFRTDMTEFDVIKFRDGTAHQFAHIRSRLSGQFNVMNILAAAATADALPLIKYEAIERGIAAVNLITGRMERIDEGQDFMALVDFAHTPNALKNALQACRNMLAPGQKLIVVFGSAGLRDREKRRLMPEVAAELADFSILTAEDPRTESLDAILHLMADAMVARGGIEGQTFIRVPDRGEALYRACQKARAGDIVIACGKGHEQSMCFGVTEYPWDDREAMRAALRGAPLKTLPTAPTLS